MRRNDFPQLLTRIQTIRIIEWIIRARQQLASTSDTPNLDSELLVGHVKQRDRTWVLTHPNQWIEPAEEQNLQNLLNRRSAGEPLPYILGKWEFFGRTFTINSTVLIPRPETEILVEAALAWLASHPAARLAADIGTGSGVIAVSLAAEVPDLHVTAADVSAEALSLARENALKFQVANRMNFIHADLFKEIPTCFDLICANLPYIPTAVLERTSSLRFEPKSALDGGPDGLRIIDLLLRQLPGRVSVPGLVLLEMQNDQAAPILELVTELYPQADVNILADLAGHPRVVRVEFD